MPFSKPNTMTQMAPKAPSALIKTARWSALLLGVLYGSWRMSYLTKYEARVQPEENRIKEFIAAKKLKIRNDNAEAEMNTLKAEIGK